MLTFQLQCVVFLKWDSSQISDWLLTTHAGLVYSNVLLKVHVFNTGISKLTFQV